MFVFVWVWMGKRAIRYLQEVSFFFVLYSRRTIILSVSWFHLLFLAINAYHTNYIARRKHPNTHTRSVCMCAFLLNTWLFRNNRVSVSFGVCSTSAWLLFEALKKNLTALINKSFKENWRKSFTQRIAYSRQSDCTRRVVGHSVLFCIEIIVYFVKTYG